GGKTITLSTADAPVDYVTPDLRTRVLALVANPQVALILMMLGIYGLFFELTSPGAALPGVAGLICLLLGLYAFQMLPVNWAGLRLTRAGSAMMVADVLLPRVGALGIGGIVAFGLGGLFLTDTGIPGFDLSLPFLAGIAIASAAFITLVGTMALRSRR